MAAMAWSHCSGPLDGPEAEQRGNFNIGSPKQVPKLNLTNLKATGAAPSPEPSSKKSPKQASSPCKQVKLHSPRLTRGRAPKSPASSPPVPLQFLARKGYGRATSADARPRSPRGSCLGAPLSPRCSPRGSPRGSFALAVHVPHCAPLCPRSPRGTVALTPLPTSPPKVSVAQLQQGDNELLALFDINACWKSETAAVRQQPQPRKSKSPRWRSWADRRSRSESPTGKRQGSPRCLEQIDERHSRPIFDSSTSRRQELHSPRRKPRSAFFGDSGKINNAFQSSVCDAKKAEDKKHPPGIHPLAYETCLSSRLEMLRNSQHECNAELLCTSQQRIEESFRSSLCEAKKQDKPRRRSRSPTLKMSRKTSGGISSRTTTLGGSSVTSMSMRSSTSTFDEHEQQTLFFLDGSPRILDSPRSQLDGISSSDWAETEAQTSRSGSVSVPSGLKMMILDAKAFEDGRRCQSERPNSSRSSLYKTSQLRAQSAGRRDLRVQALVNASMEGLDALICDVKKAEASKSSTCAAAKAGYALGFMTQKLQALRADHQRQCSQALTATQCDTPSAFSEQTCTINPAVSRTSLYLSNPVQADRTLVTSLCDEKKHEDEKHPPGMHPLAYETCLTKRGEMLRDSKCELNSELLCTSKQRMDEDFQKTLCDKKGPPMMSRMRSSPVLSATQIKNADATILTPMTPTSRSFKSALSRLSRDADARQPRERSPYATAPSPRMSTGSELRGVSPVQAQRTLEKSLCDDKKAEDEKHVPGLHPLAYESGLSKRGLMLRDRQHEVIPELVTQTHPIENDFRASLCDDKQDADKIAQQTPRRQPVKASLVGLPGFKNLWAMSSNQACPRKALCGPPISARRSAGQPAVYAR